MHDLITYLIVAKSRGVDHNLPERDQPSTQLSVSLTTRRSFRMKECKEIASLLAINDFLSPVSRSTNVWMNYRLR